MKFDWREHQRWLQHLEMIAESNLYCWELYKRWGEERYKKEFYANIKTN